MTTIPSSTLNIISHNLKQYRSHITGLAQLYDRMDNQYRELSGYYGFNCNGCEDNCCRTKFYHHTLLEYLYIKEGFDTLADERRRSILNRADAVRKAHATANRNGIVPREMCPLNIDGRCILYDYRPMICRLHGIPHQLNRPGHGVVHHQGCDAFYTECWHDRYRAFDRTPLYMEMAALERKLKSEAGSTFKFKMTIAEMIWAYHEKDRP